jgi:hypothetical protein
LPSGDPASLAASPKHAAVGGDRQPVMTVGGDTATMHTLPNQITDPEEMLLIFSEIAEAASARGDNADCDSISQGSNHSSQTGSAQAPVFFKLVLSSPFCLTFELAVCRAAKRGSFSLSLVRWIIATLR